MIMLYSYAVTLLILCPLIFLASFIDAVAGGGGLISLPAYVLVGLPIHNAYGTNKFVSSMGTATAVVNYLRNGAVDFYAAVPGALGAILGSWIGTRLALSLSPRVLQLCLMVILPMVGVFILARQGKRNKGPEGTDEVKEAGLRPKVILSCAIGLVFGCYDGFFGPGAGMFMTLGLLGLVRLDLIKAVGSTKVINLASNSASMVTWLVNGKVLFNIALPCVACSVLGGFLGSRLAVKIGKKFIRFILALVTLLLFIKILSDLLKGYLAG